MNFHSQALLGFAIREPATERRDPFGVDHASPPEDGPPPRRIPARDIIVIGRRDGTEVPPARPEPAVRRVSRRRLAIRLLLVGALIGEIAVAVKTWPPSPIPVPDASGPRTMIA